MLPTSQERLLQEIGQLRFNAWKRRELHDDPVGAEELEERADMVSERLFDLMVAR